jgi:transposase
MPETSDRSEVPAAIQTHITAIFISLELSRKIWLITSLSPGAGEKISKHSAPAGDVAALLLRFAELKRKAEVRTGKSFPIVTIQEAGLDGFWLHRLLQSEGVESHVVDPASIATSRRRRRAKTDGIDGEALLRALMAFKRGEPRVCAMVKPPTPEEEDRRRLSRERKVLVAERVEHTNRIKGLLFSQGIADYDPLARDRRQRLDELKTGDGRPLPAHLKTQIARELDRVELLLDQIKAAEAERDAMLAPPKVDAQQADAQQVGSPPPAGKMLLAFKGIGPEFASVLWHEALYRHFDNRRQLASYAGLAPTPWQSGSVDHEQGVSKAGNARLRTTLIELAWLWLQNQPKSALSLWFKERVAANNGRRKKPTIVALARKLLVALWKYVTFGVVIEGAVMKQA